MKSIVSYLNPLQFQFQFQNLLAQQQTQFQILITEQQYVMT